MSRIVLHCHSGSTVRQSVIEDAKSSGLQTNITFAHNPHALEILGSEEKTFEAFIEKFQNKDEFVVFYDSKDSRARRDVYKPHMRRADPELKAKAVVGAGSNGNTALVLANYYNFPSQAPGTKPVIAVISLGGGIQTSDLEYYWKTVQGLTTIPTVIPISVDGATSSFTGSGPDTENTLDVEISGSMCPNSTILFFSAPNTDTGFYDAINSAIAGVMVNGALMVPNVISISWGMSESGYTSSMANSFDALFSIANSKGINTFVAAGDSGSSDGVSGSSPHVDFPGSSPNVVCCGGTSLSGATETAWSWSDTYQWGTGGGISSLFKAPAYQTPVVSYPVTNPSTTSLKGNRCVPDVSLNADPVSGWTIFFDSQVLLNGVGGTSCVAPAMAGLIASMGLTFPGSFNSVLYAVYRNATQKGLCFKDITSGSNDSISGTNGIWNCGAGFDFVTGNLPFDLGIGSPCGSYSGNPRNFSKRSGKS